MPTNNFKLFDENKANLLTDTEYVNATQRLNGVQTGVASSQLNNKFAYQVSLVAYAIAQIMNQNGLDATDTLSVSAFVGNLGGSLLQKVADKASTAEAVAGVVANKYISPATMKAAALLLSGGVMSGTLNMNNNKIINLPTPTSNSEPATKGYVDGFTSKKLSQSLTLSGSVNNSSKTKNFIKNIDLNEVNAVGIKITFNKNFIVQAKAEYASFSISAGPFSIMNISFGSAFNGTIYNSGTSLFIPFFIYPFSGDFYSYSTPGERVIFQGCYFRDYSTVSPSFVKVKKDLITTSDYIGIVSDNSNLVINNFDITFDIYEIYF